MAQKQLQLQVQLHYSLKQHYFIANPEVVPLHVHDDFLWLLFIIISSIDGTPLLIMEDYFPKDLTIALFLHHEARFVENKEIAKRKILRFALAQPLVGIRYAHDIPAVHGSIIPMSLLHDDFPPVIPSLLIELPGDFRQVPKEHHMQKLALHVKAQHRPALIVFHWSDNCFYVHPNRTNQSIRLLHCQKAQTLLQIVRQYIKNVACNVIQEISICFPPLHTAIISEISVECIFKIFIASQFQKISSSDKHMENLDFQDIQIHTLQFDSNLHQLFNDLENNSKVQPSSTANPTIVEEPQHYDLKDIEKDYKSECPKPTRRIRKKKRPKIGVNLVGKARKQRKNKLYIQMMENRIFQLQKQVDSLKKVNKMSKQTLIKNHDSDHIVNGFFVNRQRHYQKMLNYVKQNKIDEKSFMEEYSMLRIRQGAVGKDRIKVINYYFKELSEIMITDLQKYILKTAQQETDLFDPNFVNFGAIGSYVEQWRKDMVNELQLSYEKLMKISQIKQEIMIERNKMEGYFNEFYNMKLKILESSRRMEMIYDRLNQNFSPREIAKCLCLIEKYKFQKGFSIQDIFKNIFSKLQAEQKECYDPDNLYEII